MEEERYARNRRFDATLLRDLLHQRTYSNPINRFSFIINRATTTSRRIMREEPSTPTHQSSDTDHDHDHTTSGGSDWAASYSKPLIVVDVVWSLGFVLVSLVLLFSTLKERPSTPLRLWIGGYALQCLLHVGFVYVEHRRRNIEGGRVGDEENLLFQNSETPEASIAKSLESMNTMMSFFWWVIGFYWIVVGGQGLLQDAPCLYWLTVIFLAFDVFFALFCVALVFMIGVAVFCCLPCIIFYLYAMVREGASEDDIKVLPRYKFRQIIEPQVSDMGWKQDLVMETKSDADSISEISLPPEDSECCICLSKYVDGVELYSLPCDHHFHCGCIAKWLRINAKCPLCKKNVLGGDEMV